MKRSVPPRKLHVLSWNCNGGDMEKLRTFITDHEPDIVCLQEMNSGFRGPKGYITQRITEKKDYDFPRGGGKLVSGGGRGGWYGILFKSDVLTQVEWKPDDEATDDEATDDEAEPPKKEASQSRRLEEIKLMSWFTDTGISYYDRPTSAIEASRQGFEARSPAILKLKMVEDNTPVTIFNWHGSEFLRT